MEPQETIDQTSTKKDRAALGWFALGSVFGAIAAVSAMLISTAARTPSSPALKVASDAPETSSAAAPASAPGEVQLSDARPFAPKIIARPANTQGSAEAAITIVEYSDFNCGFCRRFHDETFQRVIDDYVKTGKARFSYKHYPFLTASSAWKAEAAECAAEQGRFWDYHEMLFTSNVNGHEESTMRQALTEIAGQLQLDTATFAACMSESRARERVNADASEAQQLGVTGTPSFLINGKPLVGAQPYEAFKKMIDAELESLGRAAP